MEKIYKSPDQIEFAAIFEELKISRAELARQLHMGSPAVTMILQGKRNPRAQTMATIRALKPDGNHPLPRGTALDTDKSLTEELDYLRKNDPSKFESARQVIHALHQSAIGGVSLDVASVA